MARGKDSSRPYIHREGRSSTPLLFNADAETTGIVADSEAKRAWPRSESGSSSSPPSRLTTPSTETEQGGGSGSLSPSQHAEPTAAAAAAAAGGGGGNFNRSSTMHARNPSAAMAAAKASARKKYLFAAFFLSLSLVAFCVQTELSAYIQHDLGWSKAYCMMWLTHSSWVVLWPVTVLALRLQRSSSSSGGRHEHHQQQSWEQFRRRHLQVVLSTVTMIELQTLRVTTPSVVRRGRPVMYLARMTIYITSALTVAGLSWYIAVSLTTPSDLTAIYNCSAFFAYAFSVPILKEPLRIDKSVSVLIAILGVLVVAYGDTGGSSSSSSSSSSPSSSSSAAAVASDDPSDDAASRFAGNLIIGIGSVLYGLYEVLYKRYACPPDGVSPVRGTIFANVFGSCIGFFTLTVLWIPLPFLHWLDIERFEVPDAHTCALILVAVLSNALFSGCFLVLISLTSPVLSSVAALLTIFIVAIADWFLTGQPLSWAAIVGGSMIIVAFVALSWSTYREMMEHEAQKLAVDLTDDEDEGDSDHD
ncbi:Drug/metabolite transporter [Moelleriella libera RCEF 2490]|uniref:Drug/metabolite transporter n=1 Tax=Moelleriella libera RCEF 2490 TaxID=1081109 RepID=A0A166V9U0_9HYPO|nr:Drug/metabolite transporter [Moelleriella libera RCEF 2490]